MGGRKCPVGCDCGRHKCPKGCTCSRHSLYLHAKPTQKCPEGCSCNRHKKRSAEKELQRVSAWKRSMSLRTSEQEEDRYKRTVESNRLAHAKKTPAQRRKTSEKMSLAKDAMSDAARKSWKGKLSKAATQQWEGMSEEDLVALKTKLSESSYWRGLSPEQHAHHVKLTRPKGARRKKVTAENGEVLWVDSLWEKYAYDTINRHLSTNFLYTNRDNTLQIMSNGMTWSPDFIVKNLIIEVKGHPKAWEYFHDNVHPYILGLDKSIAIVDFNCSKRSFSDRKSFLGSLLWVKADGLFTSFVNRRYTGR